MKINVRIQTDDRKPQDHTAQKTYQKYDCMDFHTDWIII